MNINFKEEVLKRKEEIIKDLTGLIKINSELTTYDPKRVDAPFGEGIKDALDFMLALGEKDGFDVVNLNGYAGHISYGNQKEYVGTIGHLDVVPAGNDWTYPAYGAEIHDNKMYSRGTEDDKGPTIAVYYALKIIKELKLDLSKRIKLILGTDEETAWRGVRHYFSVYPEIPVSGFIPDADFPLIYAEKGISRVFIEGDLQGSDIVSIKGGFRDNMVPDFAEAYLKPNQDYKKLFFTFLKKQSYQGVAEDKDGKIYVKVFGKSAHGSTPEFGENAIDGLFEFLIEAKVDHNIVMLAKERLIHDIHGKKLGVAYKDEEMGHLTINLGAMSTIGNKYRFNLNLRYPNGVEFEEVISTLEKNVKAYGASVTVDNHQELLYVDPKSELVQKLLKIYRKHTNDMSDPITIGGGTFARALPNSVAFGPHFLSKPTYIHQKNEFIDLEDFFTAIMIYTESLYELAK